jgi:hypothetical protein
LVTPRPSSHEGGERSGFERRLVALFLWHRQVINANTSFSFLDIFVVVSASIEAMSVRPRKSSVVWQLTGAALLVLIVCIGLWFHYRAPGGDLPSRDVPRPRAAFAYRDVTLRL